MLFVLTITLQVGLTFIAGAYVLHEHHDWKSTILLNRPELIERYRDALKLDMPRPSTVGDLAKKHYTGKLFGKDDADGENSQCCGSSICFNSGRSCCEQGVGTE